MLSRYRYGAMPDFQLVSADKGHLVIELDGQRAGRLRVEVRSAQPVLGTLVDKDGVPVPIGQGLIWEWEGDYSDQKRVDLAVKSGSDVAYRAVVFGPRRVFERVDPRPVSISRVTNVRPAVPDELRAYLDSRLRQLGLEIPADEILEDYEDPEFDLEDDDFGPGRMDDDSEMGDPTIRRPAPPEPRERPGEAESEQSGDEAEVGGGAAP